MRHRLLAVGLVGGLACGCWLTFGAGSPAPASADGADTGEHASPMTHTSRAAAVRRATRAIELARRDVTPAPLSFDDVLARLIDLGARTLEADEQGDPDALHQATTEAERWLGRLRSEIRDAGERALARFAVIATPTNDARVGIEQGILTRIVADALADRHAHLGRATPRARFDRLVDAVLASLPLGAAASRGLGNLLVDRPYLSATHEHRVLELVDAAREFDWLADVARRLLRTLWHNLQADGSRSAGQLAALALLFGEDPEPSRRAAALEYLLTGADGRYREVAVRRAVDSGDRDLMAAVASHAAIALPVADAVAVLETLAAADPSTTTVGWMTVAQRDVTALRDVYDTRVALAVEPALRAAVVTATATSTAPDATALAETAFDVDPDVEIRARALCALTGSAPPGTAAEALHRAIDDPAFRARPIRLEGLVDALANLAPRASPDVVLAFTRRLEGLPGLPASARRRIVELRARWIPRGSESRGS